MKLGSCCPPSGKSNHCPTVSTRLERTKAGKAPFELTVVERVVAEALGEHGAGQLTGDVLLLCRGGQVGWKFIRAELVNVDKHAVLHLVARRQAGIRIGDETVGEVRRV